MAFTIILQSCDKIEPPYVQETSGSSTSENSTGKIVLQEIKGVASDFNVTDNWVNDSSVLNAVWTVTPTGSGADGTITFSWHGVSTTLNISSTSGIITFSSPVSINGGEDFGTLHFKYDATFTSSGSGAGYVVTYLVRNIFIEDYTGHTCGNCPQAAMMITSLKAIYKERVISMAVHAGHFADPYPPQAPFYTYDFRTPVGDELDDHFNISNAGNPNGMVNRKKYNGNIIVSYPDWDDYVYAIVASGKPPDAGIKIENTYSASDSTLNIKVKSGFFNNLSSTYKLCVFLIEDSIQNWQKKYPPLTPLDDSTYWHRDVLRGSANGTWGDILSPSTKGTIIEKNYSMTVKNEYRAAYCKVVAFIYEETTEEILQSKEAPIIQ
jgi:hypothetical protein